MPDTTTYYRVRRKFTASGGLRLPGEVLDVTDWPTSRASQLAEQRMIEPLPYEAPEMVACKCKRAWSPDVIEFDGKCPYPDDCTDIKVVAEQITTKVAAPLSEGGAKTKDAYEKRRTATAAKE